MMRFFRNIKVKLLLGLFLFLFIVFYLFGYFVIYSLKMSYDKTIENSLVTVLKDLKHTYHHEINNVHEFEDVKHEFDIDILYLQTVLVTKNKTTLLSASEDLDKFQLDFPQNIHLLSNESIVFEFQKNIQLTTKEIKVGSIILYQDEKEMIVLQCGIPYNKHNEFIQQSKVFVTIGLLVLLFVILGVVYLMLNRSLLSITSVIEDVKK